ncbi:MAG: integrase core domain-containing protein [Phycisphaerales bacterium]
MLHQLLFAIASSSHRELARQVRYLREENRILRSKLPARIKVTDDERRTLAKLAKALGPIASQLVSIVSPRSLQRWIKAWCAPRRKGKRKAPRCKPGRPGISDQMRDLVMRMSRENGWGSLRIVGELRKLGIAPPSRATVANLIRGAGKRPPKGDGPTWDEFVRMHALTLWQCDFITKRVWTLRGPVLRHVLFFINAATRRVVALPSTARPTPEWCAEQAERFVDEANAAGLPKPTIVTRDRDGKYGTEFDAGLRRRGVRPQALPARSPNLNAYAERWVQSIQDECLDRFVCVGGRHLDHLVAQYVEHYHRDRPHQGIGNRAPVPRAGAPRPEARAGGDRTVPRLRRVARLGQLASYRRAA